jgi:putative resolvase
LSEVAANVPRMKYGFVLPSGNAADDLVRDVTEILASFCARLYGRRSAAGKAKAAMDAAEVTA